MKTRKVDLTRSPEEELRSRVHVHLDQDGGNPSQLLEMLDLIVQDEIWTSFKMSFREFIELPYSQGGLGWSIDNLMCTLKLRHRFEHDSSSHTELQVRLKEMRRRVIDLLNGPLNGHGGDRKSSDGPSLDFPNGSNGGNSSHRILRRLKRDRPDLAERVLAKELSENAAAIEAGFVPYRLKVPVDTPTQAADYLTKHFGHEWMRAMFDAYMEAKAQEDVPPTSLPTL